MRRFGEGSSDSPRVIDYAGRTLRGLAPFPVLRAVCTRRHENSPCEPTDTTGVEERFLGLSNLWGWHEQFAAPVSLQH